MRLVADTRALFAGILFLGLFAMTARTATDPDLWWHLRTGQWIVETGHIPHTDPFSFTRGGSPWISHEWLSEVVFFELWKLAGPVALMLFSAFITTAGFLLLYWRCPGEARWAAAAAVLGACASAPCWGARPQMFTFALASLFLWLIERGEGRPRLLLWIPPLFLLWVNLHAGFALGPVLMVLYATGLVFEAATGATPWARVVPIFTRVVLATLACLALVPLNPAGARLYGYPLETVRATELRSFIVEWLSPDFHLPMYFLFLLVLLLLIAALAWLRLAIRGRVLLPVMFMLLSALDAVRHIPIFILVAVPVIAEAAAHSLPPARPSRIHALQQRTGFFFYSGAIVFLAAFALWRCTILANTQNAREADLFPRNAVAFLRVNPLPDRLFAFYDWGGYAIWNLYPQYRPFADGRSDLYAGDILKQAVQTVPNVRRGWREILDAWKVETVLIPPDAALAQALLLDGQWSVPYRDAQALVFVRNHSSQPNVTSGTIVKSAIR